MELKNSDGDVIELEDILAFRTETLAQEGKVRAWYQHGDENSVAVHFNMSYDELTEARLTPEWQEQAKAWADIHEMDYKHVKHAVPQPGRSGGVTKADFEAIGRSVVENLEQRSEPNEEDGEVHITTKEWVEEALPELLKAAEYIPNVRPTKPKKAATVSAKVAEVTEEHKENARAAGLSEDEIAKIFG